MSERFGKGPSHKKMRMEKETQKLIVVLEDCPLELANVYGEHVILCSDRHVKYIKNRGNNPMDYRPDILHQCLLMLLDSPLNKAGLLKIYFRTQKNVLVDVSPQCRLPRTFDRFCGLMVQLLQKMSIKADGASIKLLDVVKNPVTDHLPIGIHKYQMTYSTDTFLTPRQFTEKVNTEHPGRPVAIVVGGIARGRIQKDYTDGDVKISNYPLSAALVCAKLTTAFEELWKIE